MDTARVSPTGLFSIMGVAGVGHVHELKANGQLIVRQPGRKYWSGRGRPQGYAGAHWQVWQITKVLAADAFGVVTLKVSKVSEFDQRTSGEPVKPEAWAAVGGRV